MNHKEECIVVTYFVDGQPGFLDFLYRVRSLSLHYKVTLVSRLPLQQGDWDGIAAERVVFARSESRRDWLGYLFDCARLIRRHPGRRVVLLASTLAPLSLLVGKRHVALYWNEHPTHFAHMPLNASALKTWWSRAICWSLFQGARHASVVMPIGEAHRDDLLASGVSADRVRMIYMGVHTDFADAGQGQRAEDGPLQLIYVGSISQERGRDVMLDGLAQAIERGVPAHLTLIGADEAQQAHCARYAVRLGIASQLTVTGRVPGTAIPRLLGRAHAGVCLWEDRPWWRFNPPTKLFEYLVAGLPVLASDIRTHTAYVKDGRNGFIFEYSPAGFAGAIERLHRERSQLGALSAQAAQSGSTFIWDKLEPVFLRTIAGQEQTT